MKFRKRVTLMKGVKMNISKSGVSFTVGGKGLSANIGRDGLYVNGSIPGTGLYERKRILKFDGLEENIKNKITGKMNKAKQKEVALPEAAPVVEAPAAPAAPAAAVPVEEEISFANIMRLAVDVPDADAYDPNAEIEPIEAVQPTPFTEPAPSLDAIRNWLKAEAEKNVKALFGAEKKRREYVDERLELEYQAAYNEWTSRKQIFEAQQAQLAQEENERLQAEMEAMLETMRNGLNADAEYVEGQIEEWLGEQELPMDFDVEFEYDKEAGLLMVDLDLPEIEDLPDEKTVQMASGEVKTKAKSQKELKQDYVNCVLGLGVFCASNFFCITPDMERILLSAYTQRRNTKTGDQEDVYIYSVIFERRPFEKGGYQDDDPEAFIGKFKSRMIKLASGDLKKIEPYTVEDLGE